MEDPELQECRVLRIKPGDILVFETEQRLAPIETQTIKSELERVIADAGHAGIPTVIITGGHLITTRVE